MSAFRYLDVCSGISAPSMGWRDLGWQCGGYSEIEAFPRSVLAERYGAVAVDRDHRFSHGSNVTPLFGDFTQIEAHHVGPIDLLVGGTPCQDFSVAGLRAGLDGDRGNLSLEYLRLADRTCARWLVWENVPGVLSIDGGRAFGAILGGMAELGYGFAYRIFDAQHAGVPQRRRRVFVVGYLRDWRCAAAVLFERHSLSGHPAPRRETWKDLAPTISARTKGGGGLGTDFDCDGGLIPAIVGQAMSAKWAKGSSGPSGDECHNLICVNIAPTLRAGGNATGGIRPYGTDVDTRDGLIAFNSREDCCSSDSVFGSLGSSSPQSAAVAIQAGALRENPDSGPDGVGVRSDGIAYTLEARSEVQPVAFAQNSRDEVRLFGGDGSTVGALGAEPGMKQQCYVAQEWAVRRLTPRECERLQGFPDDFTLVPHRGKPAADGPRYKALGNSMCVKDIGWIGERIAMVEALCAVPESAAA